MSIQRLIKVSINAGLARIGCEIRRREPAGLHLKEHALGFPEYLQKATAAGMDVNEWQEQCLGWAKSLPILEQTTFPYLRGDSVVCNVGVGTGRWARHVAPRLTTGEIHLVDYEPWMVTFVRDYFRSNPQVHVHLNDGFSLPFRDGSCIDLIFSMGTFIALKLGMFYLYSREFARVLKPGGHAVIEYIDATRPEGWSWLEAQSNVTYANCYAYYSPEVVEKVFSTAGLEVRARHPIGRGTYLVVRKQPNLD